MSIQLEVIDHDDCISLQAFKQYFIVVTSFYLRGEYQTKIMRHRYFRLQGQYAGLFILALASIPRGLSFQNYADSSKLTRFRSRFNSFPWLLHNQIAIKPLKLVETSQAILESIPASDGNIVTAFLDAFSNAFSIRMIGTIAGNVCAVALLRYISDYLWQFVTGKQQNDSKPTIENSPDSTSNKDSSNVSKVTVTAAEDSIPASAWLSLILCVVIDVIGDASFALPGVGEVEDVAWAPISAFILSNLFGSNAIAGLDFVKEILPGADFVPVAVMAWILKYKYGNSDLSKLLGLKSDIKV